MEISLKTMSELNRLLGVIQGAACAAPSNISCVICDSVDAIDELLEKAEKANLMERMEDDGK